MEEKKALELNDETLDKVTGGDGFTNDKPDGGYYTQYSMQDEVKCDRCKQTVKPKWSWAMKKFTCPNCGTFLH